MKRVRSFLTDELGADLAENVLIVAFVAIAGTVVCLTTGSSVGGIWNATSAQIAIANGAVPAGSGSSSTTSSTNSGNSGDSGDDHGDGDHGCWFWGCGGH